MDGSNLHCELLTWQLCGLCLPHYIYDTSCEPKEEISYLDQNTLERTDISMLHHDSYSKKIHQAMLAINLVVNNMDSIPQSNSKQEYIISDI